MMNKKEQTNDVCSFLCKFIQKMQKIARHNVTSDAGADEQIRTAYLFITNEVLYRLSYISNTTSIIIHV